MSAIYKKEYEKHKNNSRYIIIVTTMKSHGIICCINFNIAVRDAGTRKGGPGGQTLLKGTDKILIMLKSIPWNLECQLHSSRAKFLPFIFLASAITLDINTSQISSIDSVTAGFIITN